MTRDLFRRESSRDEPEDLDLPVRKREVDSRSIEQNVTRQRPPDKRTKNE